MANYHVYVKSTTATEQGEFPVDQMIVEAATEDDAVKRGIAAFGPGWESTGSEEAITFTPGVN